MFDFLHGLNSELDEVRGRLLGMKPFPTIREVFAEVRREESKKKVMFSKSGHSSNEVYSPASTLNTFKGKTPQSSRGETAREKQWCDHCNRAYHTRETCWKIHGKPVNWKPKNQRRGGQAGGQSVYMVEAEKGNPTPLTITTTQLELLQQLLSQTKVTKSENAENPTPMVSLATKGNIAYSLISQRIPTNSWIIDTGASDHLTGSLNLFSNFESCDKPISVSMDDGTISFAKGKGAAVIGGLILKSVLYVPNLQCNLI